LFNNSLIVIKIVLPESQQIYKNGLNCWIAGTIWKQIAVPKKRDTQSNLVLKNN